MKKLAVTGGIGSGKSAVCRILHKLGAYVIDSDKIVHNLLSPDTPLGKKIIELFGHGIVINGQFDRKKMADIVFHDKKKLQLLEELLHPLVFHEIDTLFQKVENENKYPLFVVEIPLLFETGKEKTFDFVIVVTADKENCKTRLESIGISAHDYERRMQRQLSPEAKAKKADFVLRNNGSLEALEKEVRLLFPKLL